MLLNKKLEVKEYLEQMKMKTQSKVYEILEKAVLGRTFIVIQAYLRKEKQSQINNPKGSSEKNEKIQSYLEAKNYED